ncbi:SDR family NAD(P)-dependent oxidoreductase [Streptomyces sp. NPDC055059]|jgi:NAD(P)-dependent dehydrogenase (short-subunit alcohol dehydrogenase family)|uniref:SDR family oxidoreductase n=1 Tax=Streptomyces sp. NBC_00119 TaxID=2975659 RepID=A0AAU1U451_9ACTN|nr:MULTISPECIES: SDR family oxidoreductase [unclassified Streptomyces]MCX4642719.1 SDR family oxidoreductase [Streptomyces sp. NBC_01446]MCX5327660.1 SDR family oxidoreductase [Streptomyces sp. NBC_00120]
MTIQPFTNQYVVVTGGATGIGLATALDFAKQGAAGVIITGRRADRLAQAAELHPALVPVTADVSTREGADTVAEAVDAMGGTLDVLVHNAGVHTIGAAGEIDPDTARDLFDINVLGTVILTNRLLPSLRSPGGSIVFVTSPAGHNPTPMASVYAASKAAVNTFTRSWALELAPKGIRVNAVAPGWVRTEVYESHGMSTEQVDELFAQAAKSVPLGVTGVPEDVSQWITLLAAPSSAWMTGQILTMDGGADLVRARQV